MSVASSLRVAVTRLIAVALLLATALLYRPGAASAFGDFGTCTSTADNDYCQYSGGETSGYYCASPAGKGCVTCAYSPSDICVNFGQRLVGYKDITNQ